MDVPAARAYARVLSVRTREYAMVSPRSVPESARDGELDSLMSRYQDGDHEAACLFIERITPLLYRYFMVHATDRRYAEDLVQETWMRVHKARHTYRRGEPVLPWILALARHTGLDAYRKVRRIEARERTFDSVPESPLLHGGSAPLGPDLDTILAALPENQREVIVMLKIFGMTLQEVARATSSTVGAVKQKASRAYQKLRDVLSPGIMAK